MKSISIKEEVPELANLNVVAAMFCGVSRREEVDRFVKAAVIDIKNLDKASAEIRQDSIGLTE